jgi:hypothetical protein
VPHVTNFENSARTSFSALGSNGKIIFGPTEENLDHPDANNMDFSMLVFRVMMPRGFVAEVER